MPDPLPSPDPAGRIAQLPSEQLARIMADIHAYGVQRDTWDALSDDDRFTLYVAMLDEVRQNPGGQGVSAQCVVIAPAVPRQRCVLRAGHPEPHDNGFVQWRTIGGDAAGRIARANLLSEQLQNEATVALARDYPGWGQLMRDAAETIAALHNELEDWRATYRPKSALIKELAEGETERASLQQALLALSKKWGAEAHEIDQDGDFCCAHTRRNDAGELFDLLRKNGWAPPPIPETT